MFMLICSWLHSSWASCTIESTTQQCAAPQMCIMSGCDFLRGLSGIGVKKAHAHMRRLKSFVRVSISVCVRLGTGAAGLLLMHPSGAGGAKPRGVPNSLNKVQGAVPVTDMCGCCKRGLQLSPPRPGGQEPALLGRVGAARVRGGVPARAVDVPPPARVLRRRARPGDARAAAGGRAGRRRAGALKLVWKDQSCWLPAHSRMLSSLYMIRLHGSSVCCSSHAHSVLLLRAPSCSTRQRKV